MTDHCPACTVARELRGHRDATAVEWSCRRAMLNFAAIVADRACVGYVPASENPALNKGIEVESDVKRGPDRANESDPLATSSILETNGA